VLPTVINGLPAHVLLLHVIVILVPLGALFTVLSAVWPAARRKLGFISPLTCLIAVIFVPLTTHAGEWLEDKLTENGPNKAIEKHANLGDTFLWFAIVLLIVSAAVWWLGRMNDAASAADDVPASGGGTAVATRTRTAVPVAVTYAVAAVSIVVSVIVTWQLYRVGDSGAHAAWDYVHQLK
jgi:hypothetical protein